MPPLHLPPDILPTATTEVASIQEAAALARELADGFEAYLLLRVWLWRRGLQPVTDTFGDVMAYPGTIRPKWGWKVEHAHAGVEYFRFLRIMFRVEVGQLLAELTQLRLREAFDNDHPELFARFGLREVFNDHGPLIIRDPRIVSGDRVE